MRSAETGTQWLTWTFVAGLLTIAMAGSARLAPPACPNPAPYHATRACQRAPGLIVSLKTGYDTQATTHELEQRYGFRATSIFETIHMFVIPDLDHATLAALLCEPSIEMIGENAFFVLPETPDPCTSIPALSTGTLVLLACVLLTVGLIVLKRHL